MESGECDAIKMYAMMLECSDMAEDEREKLKEILAEELLHEHELSYVSQLFMKRIRSLMIKKGYREETLTS